MVTPATRSVILVPFPFSDLTHVKLRPALVLAQANPEDWILCQITSKPYGDNHAITLTDDGFESGSLRLSSYVRPGKLFTASQNLIVNQIGVLNHEIFKEVIHSVIKILQNG